MQYQLDRSRITSILGVDFGTFVNEFSERTSSLLRKKNAADTREAGPNPWAAELGCHKRRRS